MKKLISLSLILVLMLSLVACSSQPQGDISNTEAATSENKITETKSGDAARESESDTSAASNTLVVYFSRTGEQYGVGVIEKGNTAIVADMITEQTGADSFEILPKEDNYPTTYDALTDYAKEEQNNNARPEIKDVLPDLSKYDTIFIGAPVWWGDWPMIMYTYFEANDFSGKKLVPFCTHEGSGLSGFDTKLQSACPGSEVSEGLAITGTDAQNNQDSVKSTVNDWLYGLGY